MRELRTNSLTILAVILVSLCAASFPTLSKRISFLRIPPIVFFIGKHFRTGVILSTAFTHLLQDAFEALRNPIVRAQWKIGKHTGLIVLGSLLFIFLIEFHPPSRQGPSLAISRTPGTMKVTKKRRQDLTNTCQTHKQRRESRPGTPPSTES
ncbi:hypothetical protein BKA82DRAFT_4201527 [Pisolithus tinctorius]|nr:hypothetical protein BKA82DRAFT_4201527 [Pisolithus tinctorius]